MTVWLVNEIVFPQTIKYVAAEEFRHWTQWIIREIFVVEQVEYEADNFYLSGSGKLNEQNNEDRRSVRRPRVKRFF